MNDLRLREIQLAAQKEAEELYGYDSQVTMKDGTVIPSRSATQAARYSAHVKCALLYSERAAGLVEAIDDLMRACKAVTNMSIVCPEDAEMEVSQCGDALRSARAALHAFNSQT